MVTFRTVEKPNDELIKAFQADKTNPIPQENSGFTQECEGDKKLAPVGAYFGVGMARQNVDGTGLDLKINTTRINMWQKRTETGKRINSCEGEYPGTQFYVLSHVTVSVGEKMVFEKETGEWVLGNQSYNLYPKNIGHFDTVKIGDYNGDGLNDVGIQLFGGAHVFLIQEKAKPE